MCSVTSLDSAQECGGNYSRSLYSRSAEVRSDDDGANGNHLLLDSIHLVMLWRSQGSLFCSSLRSAGEKKKKTPSRRVTLRKAEFLAVPRCCCADVLRADPFKGNVICL